MIDLLSEVTRLAMGLAIVIVLIFISVVGLFALYYAIEYARMIPTPGIVLLVTLTGIFLFMRRRD